MLEFRSKSCGELGLRAPGNNIVSRQERPQETSSRTTSGTHCEVFAGISLNLARGEDAPAGCSAQQRAWAVGRAAIQKRRATNKQLRSSNEDREKRGTRGDAGRGDREGREESLGERA